MTTLDRSFARMLWIALSIAMLAAWLAACAGPRVQAVVPEPLRPDAERMPAFTLAARGVQIYECRAGANGAAPGGVANAIGMQVRVPYTADCHFFTSNERNPT